MERITEKHLQGLVDHLNELTEMPKEPWTKTGDNGSPFVANIGNYHLSGAYGGWALEQMSTTGGGVRSVFECGYQPKRDLYNRIRAFMQGIKEERNSTR